MIAVYTYLKGCLATTVFIYVPDYRTEISGGTYRKIYFQCMQQIMHIMIMYLEYIETNFKNQERKRLLKEKWGKDKNRQFTEEKRESINT